MDLRVRIFCIFLNENSHSYFQYILFRFFQIFCSFFSHYKLFPTDKRCKDWLFLSGPGTPLLISLAYLFAVYILLPKFMENRKAYDLRMVIRIYNVVQIFSCCFIIHGVNFVFFFDLKN